MFLSKYSEKVRRLVSFVDDEAFLLAASYLESLGRRGNKVLLVGNGGSAAICSHLAVDITKSAGIRAINFSDSALLTCFGNDYGFMEAYSEMVRAYCDQGDVLIAISSSGASLNILNAVHAARSLGMSVITLSGFGCDNPLRKLGDINFYLESSEYNLVENGHEQILLALCDYLRLGDASFRNWVDGE